MKDPWEEIALEDYEAHMGLSSVGQLQAMNAMMRAQFAAYPVSSAMVLGVAGGNGLEHVPLGKFRRVYGVDINEDYLKETARRFPALEGVLVCLWADLREEAGRLPKAELVIANLLVEYIGSGAFRKVLGQVEPRFVSCGIQVDAGGPEDGWVSPSPYRHAFDALGAVHHEMDAGDLERELSGEGYRLILSEVWPLPNGKALRRLDFRRED